MVGRSLLLDHTSDLINYENPKIHILDAARDLYLYLVSAFLTFFADLVGMAEGTEEGIADSDGISEMDGAVEGMSLGASSLSQVTESSPNKNRVSDAM